MPSFIALFGKDRRKDQRSGEDRRGELRTLLGENRREEDRVRTVIGEDRRGEDRRGQDRMEDNPCCQSMIQTFLIVFNFIAFVRWRLPPSLSPTLPPSSPVGECLAFLSMPWWGRDLPGRESDLLTCPQFYRIGLGTIL